MNRRSKKYIIITAEILFLTVLIFLFLRILNFNQFKRNIRIIKPSNIAVILLFQSAVYILGALHWSVLLKQAGIKRSFLSILRARISGFSVSYITPSFYFGGEPVRASLLKDDKVTYNSLFATVTLDKYIELFSKFPAVIIGLSLLVILFDPAVSLIIISGIVTGLLIGVFLFLLIKLFNDKTFIDRFFKILLKPFAKLKPGTAVKLYRIIRDFEKEVGVIIREKKYFYLAISIGVLVSFIEVMQTYYILSLLHSQNLIKSFIIFSSTIFSAVFTFIPANLGGMESVNLFIFTLLGLGAGRGLVYTIILRIGHLGFVALGLLNLMFSRIVKKRNENKA
ncbi:MAG: flippase-like domain-containing protein [Spirochaetes bacterium]|nr:flippase-like domain-containing protein [Spirochaetota bacterium]